MIEKEEFYFGSRDGEHKLHAVKWHPETETPICILQIIHGMSEHIGRYEDFARYLAGKGILVVGDDHLGHGLSVKTAKSAATSVRRTPPLCWCGMSTD